MRHHRQMEGVIEGVVRAVGTSMRLDVDEQSQIGGARRAAVTLAHGRGLSSDAVGRLALVVTEAATNIVRHGGRGAIILRTLSGGGTAAVEMLALDKGPGIYDVPRAMRDGYSTAGTAGKGLGAISRLSEVFSIHSQRGAGTVVLARVGERTGPSNRARRVASIDDRVGAVCAPLRGEVACGDAWCIIVGPKRVAVMLVDGLGHGPEAAAAADAATATFPSLAGQSPDVAIAGFAAALRNTRGAALSMAIIDEAARVVRFGGVGNVDGRVLSTGPTEYLVPQNGIVGMGTPGVRCSTASWPAGARLVMHSDGIGARWRVDAYAGLANAHPALLAGVIYRDFARDRDDATVLVVSENVPDVQQ